MANTISKKTILDGDSLYILELEIEGDGSGEETGTNIIDVSAIGGTPSGIVIRKAWWSLTGFSASLLWDATTDVLALQCYEGEGGLDYMQIGGPIQNNAGTGKTGDLLMTTVGLGSGDKGTIRLECRKK